MTSDNDKGQNVVRDRELAARLQDTNLGGFQILTPIGAGGMGTVFLARQISIGRTVAIKVVRDTDVDASRDRFMREARLISQIDHPNVVQLIDFGHDEAQKVIYYAMEHIEGLSLSRLTRRGRLHPNLAIELAVQICSALAEAHARGIVHRDLKASNMLVTVRADGGVRVRVLDFGIAHTFEDTADLTQTGVLCGTPAYMAPEQAQGFTTAPSIDIYALGINLHLMLAGEVPFSGANAISIVVRQIQDSAPSLQPYAEQSLVPYELLELLEQLLAKDPADRPASATDVRQKLLAVRQRAGWDPVVLSPPEAKTLNTLIRPPLARETQTIPASWRVGTASDSSDTIRHEIVDRSALADTAPDGLKPGVPAASPADASRSGPVLRREGGGWDAFHATTAPAQDPEPQAMVINPVTGEYMSVHAGNPEAAAAAPQNQRPASSVPPQEHQRGRTFAEEELVVDLPERPRGTVVNQEPEDEGLSTFTFVAIAGLAFIAVLGIAFVFSARGSDKTPGEAADPAEVARAVATPDSPDSQTNSGAEEDAREEPPRAKSRPKRPSKPPRKSRPTEKSDDEPEPIDLFKDVEDPPDKAPIVIEEEPP